MYILLFDVVDAKVLSLRGRAGGELSQNPRKKNHQNYVIASWHNNCLSAILSHDGKLICLMVSLSFDGEFVAFLGKKLGMSSVRGSFS